MTNDMMTVLTAPADPQQRFTVGLDAEGNAVQRTVAEMTAAEILAALKWQDELVARLATEAESARQIANAVKAGTGAAVTKDDLIQTIETLQAHGAELTRKTHLLTLIRAAMSDDVGEDFVVALRRYMPR